MKYLSAAVITGSLGMTMPVTYAAQEFIFTLPRTDQHALVGRERVSTNGIVPDRVAMSPNMPMRATS